MAADPEMQEEYAIMQKKIAEDDYDPTKKAVVAEDLLGNTYFDHIYFVDQGDPDAGVPDNPETKWDELKKLKDRGYRNVFYYPLFDGMNIELTKPSYNSEIRATIEVFSDIYMRELGDFNSGSASLNPYHDNNYTQQPFLALAKREWVYRKSPMLATFSDSTRDKYIEALLLNGPKFHEILISADRIKSYIDGPLAGKLSSSLYTDNFADELYAIATGT